ncbi:hypothetical protein FACS189421_07290 [Bacteroidia bacterium]|jgi:hypothetical protein|nr:hypothetical protein FACS189421_07290 [Bacteroidia bacterium]GHT03288.1 hypothetical protein FACS189423_03850 [Bacteroidia bacterium]GHT45580.1 hypothetical protein FACS189440_01830 [Bacteroidia bacterium]
MQAVKLKKDIISYVTGLDDKKLIQELYQWVITKEKAIHSADFIPPKRKGNLTEGYGIWFDDVLNNEQDYRKNIWRTERNVW